MLHIYDFVLLRFVSLKNKNEFHICTWKIILEITFFQNKQLELLHNRKCFDFS